MSIKNVYNCLRQRNDPYVKMAQAEGYRARSAYKLIEINQRFGNRLLTTGMAVMECGCAPGAWTQVHYYRLKKFLKGGQNFA